MPVTDNHAIDNSARQHSADDRRRHKQKPCANIRHDDGLVSIQVRGTVPAQQRVERPLSRALDQEIERAEQPA